jgi:hypothetical protein
MDRDAESIAKFRNCAAQADDQDFRLSRYKFVQADFESRKPKSMSPHLPSHLKKIGCGGEI